MEATISHKILICLGSSCHSRGNAENLKIIQDFVKERKIDSQIDFRGHLCHEMCNRGPVIELDEIVFEEVTPSNLPTILSKHFDKATCI
ncbi:(2Fe-2S) ferredoxin domain-containing protein [Carboxylicivirga sediminis]|uniref:(2Fe-2S) ferredoxin domain-containing protein n=1 Tax=Carboxylicivirga sediminis TaxID=2006564 RepID=A0A941F6B8_9BACT|nr:(2Fe-2S) ferredoxin domain-containing protein [Carboxylicivirga sediminis]MBR8537182.1 (2Fe-2S) ferredoxin domain-containing protein [Carboxylicivirga sediminis]